MYCPIQDIQQQRNSDGNVNDGDDDIDMDNDVKFDNVGESNNEENIKMLLCLSS